VSQTSRYPEKLVTSLVQVSFELSHQRVDPFERDGGDDRKEVAVRVVIERTLRDS
jgi:hypothetical protein